VKLITHLHLAHWLRASGAIPLIPLYAYKVWTGKTSPSFIRKEIVIFCKFSSNNSNKYQQAMNGQIYNHSLTQFVWKLLQCLPFSRFGSIVPEVSILLEYNSSSVGNSFQTFCENDGLKMLGMYYPSDAVSYSRRLETCNYNTFVCITSLQVTSSSL